MLGEVGCSLRGFKSFTAGLANGVGASGEGRQVASRNWK